MKKDDVELRIGQAFSERLDGFQFMKSSRKLKRKTTSGWQSIFVDLQRTSNPDILRLIIYAQIRIESLSGIYAHFHPNLSNREAKLWPTIIQNGLNLMKDVSLVYGFTKDEASIAKYIDAYYNDLVQNVIPWLDKYSDEKTLFDEFICADPLKWPIPDRIVRYSVVLTVLAKKQDKTRFNEMVEELEAHCQLPHAGADKPKAAALISGLRERFELDES